MPVAISVKSNAEVLSRSLDNLWKFDKQMVKTNRILARKSVAKIRGAMLSAGIKWHSGGSLARGVSPQNITSRGWDIFVPRIAVILHHGVREHPIRLRTARVLAMAKEGTIVFRHSVEKHQIRPHPWIERAVRNISKMLGEGYQVDIQRVLRKVKGGDAVK